MPKDNSPYNSTLAYLNSVFKHTSIEKPITDSDLRESDLEAINSHNKTYTEYLDKYVLEFKNKSRSQRIMKNWFFVIVMLLLSVIIITSFVSLVIISSKKIIGFEEIATLLTAIGGAIASFLVLPKIIAENLFPSKEEDKTDIIFAKMFDHDMSLRELHNRNKIKTANPTGKDMEEAKEIESLR